MGLLSAGNSPLILLSTMQGSGMLQYLVHRQITTGEGKSLESLTTIGKIPWMSKKFIQHSGNHKLFVLE